MAVMISLVGASRDQKLKVLNTWKEHNRGNGQYPRLISMRTSNNTLNATHSTSCSCESAHKSCKLVKFLTRYEPIKQSTESVPRPTSETEAGLT
jgi:hypothetical protein